MAFARPALAYGARVNGINDTDLLKVQRLLACNETPRCSGSSLTMRLILARDPSWSMAVGPVLAWSAEMWRSTTTRDDRALTMPYLLKA